MRGALFTGSAAAARASPPMTLAAPLFDEQYYPPYPYHHTQGPRYASAPFPAAAPALLPAANTDALAAYAARPSWSAGSQHGSDYDSPNSTPYSEYGPPLEQEYYSPPAPAPQSVAYPESSQRTHVADAAAYGALYGAARYYSPASTAGALSPRASRSPEEELASYQFSAGSSHNPSPVLAADSPLRGAPAAQWADYAESPAAYDRPGAYARPPPAHASSAPAARTGFPAQRSPARDAPPAHGSSSSSSSSHHHLRGLGEPGNPAVVPPLVYDGEEYDDESEGSLPSAGADAYRYAAARGPDDAAGEHGGELRSPTPPTDGGLASPRTPAGERLPKAGCQKKSKMHQCTVCQKWFPRPSGLATHMNSHSGAKPYKCPIPSCEKSFAVRSNAKRHLRTHGIFPSNEHPAAPSQFTVGFDAPIISEVHEVAKIPAKLRWVPQSLATRTNVEFLRDAPSDSDEEYPPSCPVLSVPLPAVVPSSPKWAADDAFEDRNSYEDMGASPYLDPHQWRALPGPAIVNPSSL